MIAEVHIKLGGLSVISILTGGLGVGSKNAVGLPQHIRD